MNKYKVMKESTNPIKWGVYPITEHGMSLSAVQWKFFRTKKAAEQFKDELERANNS